MQQIRWQVKNLFYLLIVVVLSIFIFYWARLPKSYWIIWSAFFLAFVNQGDSFSQRVTTIAYTAIVVNVSIYLTDYISFYPWLLFAYLAFLSGACIYAMIAFENLAIPIFIVNLLTVIASGESVSIFQVNIENTFVLMGALIVLIAQIIYWFHFVRNQFKENLLVNFKNLKSLNDDIFACYLQPEYKDNLYLYERRLHIAKNRFMKTSVRLNNILLKNKAGLPEEKSILLNEIIAQLTWVYDSMLAYAQLRRQVTDYTIFSLCNEELKQIKTTIGNLFNELGAIFSFKNPISEPTQLTPFIQDFENTYEHILRVSAREPLAILLFIDSLRSFEKTMVDVYKNIFAARILFT